MIKRILVPLDGSPASECALVHVESLLRRVDASVTLLTVSSYEAAARSYLDGVAARLKDMGASIDVATRVGLPAEQIVRAAVEGNFDLVAICRRAKAVRRLLLGSVTEDVLRRSPVPVYVAGTPGSGGEILVPLDGSHRAQSILPVVADFAEMYGSKLALLVVAALRVPAEVAASNLIHVQEALERRRIPNEIVIRYGEPARQILAVARERDVDLIAMSTHGRTGLKRVAYGSVAERVLRKSARPLLMLRTEAVPREHRPSGRSAAIVEKTLTALEQVREGMALGGYDRR